MYTGSEAAAMGLQPGQCVLIVNGNNMKQSSYQEVLEHFSGHQPVLEQQDTVRINATLCLRLHHVFFLLAMWSTYGHPRGYLLLTLYTVPVSSLCDSFFFCHRVVVSGRTVCMRMWKSRCLLGGVRMAQIQRTAALMEQVVCVFLANYSVWQVSKSYCR